MSLSSLGTSHTQDWLHSEIAKAGRNVEECELEDNWERLQTAD